MSDNSEAHADARAYLLSLLDDIRADVRALRDRHDATAKTAAEAGRAAEEATRTAEDALAKIEEVAKEVGDVKREVAEVRAHDRGSDGGAHHVARLREAVVGVVFVLLGLAVLVSQPEHGQVVAIFLVGFGCLLIDRKAAVAAIKSRTGGE